MDEQAEAARRRLAMVPIELRPRLTKRMRELAPDGTRFCAGCCSYRDEIDFGGEKQTQCHACRSGRAHAAMVEKTYGITADEYSAIQRFQGGRCAICRASFRTRRGAVDHHHKKSGSESVRGILCSRCNHELLGAAHDDIELLRNALIYLETPPTQLMREQGLMK